MNPLLEKHLGTVLSASEVAEFLRCNIATVYRNYKSLGGVRIGSSYRFFEKSLINAILEREKKAVGRASNPPRGKVSLLSEKQDRSQAMGGRKANRNKESGQQLADPHGILA